MPDGQARTTPPGPAYRTEHRYAEPGMHQKTNTKAIVSLVFGILSFFVLPLIGAIVAVWAGHSARREIFADPMQKGSGMALIGLVLGWINLVAAIIVLIGLLVAFA